MICVSMSQCCRHFVLQCSYLQNVGSKSFCNQCVFYNWGESFKTLKAFFATVKLEFPPHYFYYVNVIHNKFKNICLCVIIKHSDQSDGLFLMKMK